MTHHSRGFVALGGAAPLIAQIAEDYTAAELPDNEMAMLGYVAKLTIEPCNVTAEDVEILREHGFDDRAIHDIAQVTAYFNYVNRIADGLGVELENE